MFYKSTRGNENLVTASEAIIRGIAEDGGLFVPELFPKIDKTFDELKNLNYKELAFYVLSKYFDDFSAEELKACIEGAYDEKFEDPAIAPLKYSAGAYFLELFHGKTLAFKDMALSILPYLVKIAAKRLDINKEIVILTATSGDTGKAALEGFAKVKGTKIVVFYPKEGVSEIQKRQMITQEGENTFVVGIEGNFDDAQNGVKTIFGDSDFNKLLDENGYMLSSANSINIGRLIPQIVYYVYAYVTLLKDEKVKAGEKINVVVPTGNFGNILAAFYAKNMGLPIDKLICASNENKVLTDFINTGVYDKNRDFVITNSPSMDILISSNLERFLYEISGKNSDFINELMEQLRTEGRYEINSEMKERLEELYGGFATEEETIEAIKEVYASSKYVLDTHTAVAYNVFRKYVSTTKDDAVTVIASTASPFKFPRSVNEALSFEDSKASDFEMVEKLSKEFNIRIPKGIDNLESKPIIHTTTCDKENMKNVIEEFLKL
ncbi:threonine synthase [Clostridium manihotivorum]|uniref:Threonine synthase n=1 Tax=Clostridium manihotivorum TaxID=2320868 RepID=A0A3R5X5C7_9CLOT|nr:threonine synthase [Clostridium manihotivorum]QAA35106.1 threonine synthase [Clostridium manihotivorum]